MSREEQIELANKIAEKVQYSNIEVFYNVRFLDYFGVTNIHDVVIDCAKLATQNATSLFDEVVKYKRNIGI